MHTLVSKGFVYFWVSFAAEHEVEPDGITSQAVFKAGLQYLRN